MVALSPDGRRVATSVFDSSGNRDMWTLDLDRGVQTRLTSDGQVLAAVWSPNSQDLAYSRLSSGVLLGRDASGAGNEQTMLRSNQVVYMNDWSLDGRYWLYEEVSQETQGDLWLMPTSGDRKPMLYLRTKGNESNGQFSPDSKWVAYVSDESGPEQVYVQSLPVIAAGRKWQVSTGGGNYPRWRKDGNKLFYRDTGGMLMSVSVRTSAQGLQLGVPTPLFRTLPALGPHTYNYDVSADGQRILSLAASAQKDATPLTVLLNWQVGLH